MVKRYQINSKEVLLILKLVTEGTQTPKDLIKKTKTKKQAVSEKLTLLLNAGYVDSTENKKDRRHKIFTINYNGLQKGFIDLVKQRIKERKKTLEQIDPKTLTPDQKPFNLSPKQFIEKALNQFEEFNKTEQGQTLFKELFNEAIHAEDFAETIEDIFNALIYLYSNLADYVPKKTDQIILTTATAIATRKFNLYPLEEKARQIMAK